MQKYSELIYQLLYNKYVLYAILLLLHDLLLIVGTGLMTALFLRRLLPRLLRPHYYIDEALSRDPTLTRPSKKTLEKPYSEEDQDLYSYLVEHGREDDYDG